MEQPIWLNNALLSTALNAYSSSDVPITICITPLNITFVRNDGLTYQHWPVNLTTVDLPIPPPPEVTPVTQDEPPSDNLPVPQNVDVVDDPGTPDGPSADSSPPAPPQFVQELLRDLNNAPAERVPEFQIPPGDHEAKVSLLTLQYIKEARRPTINALKLLRIANHLGAIYEDRPLATRTLLLKRLGHAQQARLLRIIKRTRLIVQKIGLSRLYGTTLLTPDRLSKFTSQDFRQHLLPGIQANSEDLVLRDGGGVTSPSSPPAEDWIWIPDDDQLEHSDVP